MRNEIYLNRKLKLVIKEKESKNSRQHLATMLKNVESLGFIFSKDIVNILKTYSIEDLTRFYKTTIEILKKMVGANVVHNPMYPNFPDQVMEMDELELYFNAIIHYWTTDVPEYDKEDRKKLKGKYKLKVVALGTKEDFDNIFKNLFGAKVALSKTDRKDVAWIVRQYREDIVILLPSKISNKENLSYLFGLLKTNNLLSDDILSKWFKTPTDILRLITALSDGDVSLASNTKFINFKRSDRRLFLKVLENSGSLGEDILRHKNKWLRVGEILHPMEYKNKYPKCYDIFDKLRNDKKIETFNSKVELCIKENKLSELLVLLESRPGEFARKLDRLLRIFANGRAIVKSFGEVANKVANPILLQLVAHFKTRNENAYRAFFPKGSIAKIQLIENTLGKIDSDICDEIVDACNNALQLKFASEKTLGNVYIDERLRDYTVPFALRSTSKALKTVTRGSKIEMDKGKAIRMFIYWKNIGKIINQDAYYDKGRVDIDLSAVLYNEDWKYLEHVSYTNLKSAKYQSCHSGDITNAPKGASEFIDVDIESALKYGARYIVMNVLSFTQQPFTDIPTCFAGCMIRDNVDSGDIFEPKTVQHKFDITTDSTIVIPLIFDLVDNKIIWSDVALSSQARYNAVECNQTGIIAMGKALTTLSKPNLYDLFTLHTHARGKLVEKKKDADVIFSVDEGITPYDIDVIIGEYL